MIDRSGAEAVVTGKALGLAPGQTLRIASFKRDRWIELRRARPGEAAGIDAEESNFVITQHGFGNAVHTATPKNMRKLLKQLFKTEFPRSKKLHVTMSGS